jgi:hypothetical protein
MFLEIFLWIRVFWIFRVEGLGRVFLEDFGYSGLRVWEGYWIFRVEGLGRILDIQG